MSNATRKLLGTTPAAAGGQIDISEYFSTYLYTGNGSTQTITNGIDLAGEGGLVWIKSRTDAFGWHRLIDTVRGDFLLSSNSTNAQSSGSGVNLTSFNSDGFSLGASTNVNASSDNYASWTFRKAPRFFDVVTYTGDGSGGALNIAHSLGVAPGCVIVKRTDSSGDWGVWHRGGGGNTDVTGFRLNGTNSAAFSPAFLSSTMTDITFDSSSVFPDSSNGMNISGATYVAYLFAHDPLGPSGDGSDGLIACGSYTGDGTTNGSKQISLGWEPQWLLIKNTTSSDSWVIMDNMRGLVNGGGAVGADAQLNPNTSGGETGFDFAHPIATGFALTSSSGNVNQSGQTYIYIAIRRGPMRTPTSGTEVFDVETKGTLGAPAYNSGFPVDMTLVRNNKNTTFSTQAWDRLRSTFSLTNSTAVEEAFSSSYLDYFAHNDGFDVAGGPDTNDIAWMFRRAPGFFDAVAYLGDGTYPAARAIPHNLGVAPELMIYKCRSASVSWEVQLNVSGSDYLRAYLDTNLAAAGSGSSLPYGGYAAAPDASNVYIRDAGGDVINGSGQTYIAYLFAPLPGISKVGSYTGNGTSQTINCGFTSGARLVLIKATSTTGDWLIADTARGIVSGNDPYLELNTTNAEVTSEDWLDPDSSGFVVNEVSGSNANTSGVSYIYLAIA